MYLIKSRMKMKRSITTVAYAALLLTFFSCWNIFKTKEDKVYVRIINRMSEAVILTGEDKKEKTVPPHGYQEIDIRRYSFLSARGKDTNKGYGVRVFSADATWVIE